MIGRKLVRKTRGKTMSSEQHFLVIQSGEYVWTRADTWALAAEPYLIKGGLAVAKQELQRAESYRREEYPHITENAVIGEVSLCEC